MRIIKCDYTVQSIAESDKRIHDAIEDLNGSVRGKTALKDLKTFLNSNQQGLDVVGTEAIVTLVAEFFINHRRGFIQ
jgi:hypothetical protein